MGASYGAMVEGYNTAHRDHLTPIDVGGPNALFALVTQAHMAKYGLDREAYGKVVVSQRAWAGTNPRAAYRAPLSMEEYLAAPMIADPLGLLDCPPIVAGAEAVVVSAADRGRGRGVSIRAIRASFNHDHQEGEGLRTGLADLAPSLWDESGIGPEDVDVVGIYDDYPVIVLVHLEDLGFVSGGDARGVLLGPGGRGLPVNTAGGLLTAGQSGAGGGLHALVECVRQLRGEREEGQVDGARVAVVAGYGMVLYRYASCSVAAVLEAA
jgi:acetyl-CoA acetyltransferase